ncbi:M56 family metallopeptidase [Cognatitamlana onchidii]|uniref:M56 family metallopeptidase n=1 Tax=Cognatitamlana onchidii TaxID=2562860 RepID=UPI00145615E9|nr:M56 family metallopeptidase [Algibacter onchidii]
MLFYKFCLEQTSAHTFKRFYLIVTILISIGIPFITFTKYILVEPVSFDTSTEFMNQSQVFSPEIIQPKNYLPTILWSIYGIGVITFSYRFFKNLYEIVQKIEKSQKFKTDRFNIVLLNDLIHPHTFFNFIFLNKSKFESNLIPTEILLHEQVHARQKHAIDILFIELLQIVFWFNPLLYFIKKDIKLNHEFLADQAVIKSGSNIKQYQQLLLAFSSNASPNQLVNAINYSLIKKRFTVMNANTSKTQIWVRSLILFPLLAILIYSFSAHKKTEKYIATENLEMRHIARIIEVEVFENGTYKIDGITATKATFVSTVNKLHQDISPEIRNQIINIHVNDQKIVSDEEVWFIYNSVLDYGFHRIVTYNQEIIRAKGNKPFAIESSDKQNGATKKQVDEYNVLAKKYNKKPQNKRIIKLKDIKRLEYLFSLMSESQKNNAQPLPNYPPPPPNSPKVKKGEQSDIPTPPPSASKVKESEYSKFLTPANPRLQLDHTKQHNTKESNSSQKYYINILIYESGDIFVDSQKVNLNTLSHKIIEIKNQFIDEKIIDKGYNFRIKDKLSIKVKIEGHTTGKYLVNLRNEIKKSKLLISSIEADSASQIQDFINRKQSITPTQDTVYKYKQTTKISIDTIKRSTEKKKN